MVSFKLIIGLLFGLLVIAISVLSIISYRNSKTLNRTSFLIRHTEKVIDQAEEISSLYKDIQLESNAFYAIDDSAFIAPYRQARNSIINRIRSLRSLTTDNPHQLERIDSLEILLKNMMVYNDSVMFYVRPEGYSKAGLVSRVQINRSFRVRIKEIITDIQREEKELLASRELANEQSIAAFRLTLFLMLAAIASLLGTAFFSIKYNFDKRIRAQQELKRAGELFAKLFHESPAAIVINRLHDGVILDCNQAYSELLNYSVEELKGKTAAMLGILENKEQRDSIVRGALEHGAGRDIEVQLKPKDKGPIWVSISMQVIQVQEERCLMSVILDMTAHKEAEDKIKMSLTKEIELNKMKSDFVSMASHEFRTPLTTILSSTFLLENSAFRENPEGVKKHLARIRSAVNILTSILDEFLSLSKIEEGKVKPRFERLNAREYIENVCANIKSFAKPGQRIFYSHEGDPDIYTDPVLLGNIINNLVSNAIKYSPPDSVINVSSEMNARLHLTVKDTGIGIPAEDQKHLFKRFYRGSNAGNIQGTGLGLHIMKEYVEMLNGRVDLTSELGKGTEFKITFEQHLPENS